MRRTCWRACLSLLLLGVVSSPVAAQPAAKVQPPTDPGAALRNFPENADTLPAPVLADMLDAYAIVQAKQALSIADDRYVAFAARLKKLQDTRRRNQRIRMRMLQDLRRLTDARGPEATGDEALKSQETAIKTQLAALREHDQRAAADLRHAYDSLDELLDARQQARFRVFEEQIERRKLDLIVRATRERGRATKQ